MNYAVPIRTVDWEIQSVYTTRNKDWKPVNCVIRMTTPGYDYEKKLYLGFAEIQSLVPFMIDVEDPEVSLKHLCLRIVESAVVIDDYESVQEMN